MKLFDKLIIYLMTALYFIGCSASISRISSTQENLPKIVFGTWYVKGFSSLLISALSDEEAQRFVKQSMTLDSNLAIVFKDSCSQPNYVIMKVNADNYFRQFETSKESIEIKSDSIFTIDLSCKKSPKYFNEDSPNFSSTLIYDGERLSIIHNGIVFHLERHE